MFLSRELLSTVPKFLLMAMEDKNQTLELAEMGDVEDLRGIVDMIHLEEVKEKKNLLFEFPNLQSYCQDLFPYLKYVIASQK